MELANKPRKPKESNQAVDAQRDIGAHEWKQNSACDRPLRKGINDWPKKGSSRIKSLGRNNNSTWQAVKKTKSEPKKCKVHYHTRPSSWMERKNQRKAHMKGQETQTENLQVAADTWAAGRLLDKFEREARATNLYPANIGHGGAMGQR